MWKPPANYILSKTYSYRTEVVHIYTDGENYIFASGEVQPEGDVLWLTISEPARIGNAP